MLESRFIFLSIFQGDKMVIDITRLDGEIISVIKDNQGIASLGRIYALVDNRQNIIDSNIKKLLKKEIIVSEKRSGFTIFQISNKAIETLIDRTVVCPKCKTIRKIRYKRQYTANCANPDCVSKSGVRTKFWIINRENGAYLNEYSYVR